MESFYREEFPRVFGAIALYCGDAAVAEEIAQEALLKAFTSWRTIRKDDPSAWVHRVAINLANSHYRRRTAERRALTRAADTSRRMRTGPDNDVMAAVAELPKRPKTALVLRHFLGYSTVETAHLMGCSERTVKRLLHQSIERMRIVLERDRDRPVEAPSGDLGNGGLR